MSSLLYGCEAWLDGNIKPMENLYNMCTHGKWQDDDKEAYQHGANKIYGGALATHIWTYETSIL